LLAEPAAPWQGVLQAKFFKPGAPQNKTPPYLLLPGFEDVSVQSEDCLYLNIWTPALDGKARPVMVWIHGGGFIMGSASQPAYEGHNLCSRGNVVLVSINYRLGLFGFLNLNEITGGIIPSTGNEGLLDQVLALKWVRDNISSFGGDPGNVTVFGESAGAMSIGCLIVMPEAKGLFHRGILESGTGHMARPLASGVKVSEQFIKLTGTAKIDSLSLRSLSAEQILSIQQQLTLTAPGKVTPVAPLIDGKIIPQKPLDAACSGSVMKVPIIVGTNLDEMNLFRLRNTRIVTMTETELVQACNSILPPQHVQMLLEAYKEGRSRRMESISPEEIMAAIQTDLQFRIPAIKLIEAYCRNGIPAYNYLFTWKSPLKDGILGACHTLEMGFVFGTVEGALCGTGRQVEELSLKMQDAWVSFARTGDPGCKLLGNWPSYCNRQTVMILGQPCQAVEDPYKEEWQAWDMIGEVPMVI
jgi:para-nitrobenzyl esterase